MVKYERSSLSGGDEVFDDEPSKQTHAANNGSANVNSTANQTLPDGTMEVASNAPPEVRFKNLQGKGAKDAKHKGRSVGVKLWWERSTLERILLVFCLLLLLTVIIVSIVLATSRQEGEVVTHWPTFLLLNKEMPQFSPILIFLGYFSFLYPQMII